VLATASVLAPVSAAAGEPSVEERLQGARRTLVTDLVALANWTVGQGLDAQRERTLEFVLTLDADHAEARRALGWKRRRGDGQWIPPAARDAAVDTRPSRLPVRDARWRKAFAAYGDAAFLALGHDALDARPDVLLAVTALLARGVPDEPRVVETVERVAATLRDPRAGPEVHERLEDLLEAHLPDDERVRAVRGHVRGPDGWILAESARACARRTAFAERTVALRAETPVAPTLEVTAFEAQAGLDGLRAFGSRERRVVGTVDPKVLEAVAFHLARAPTVFELAFGEAPKALEPESSWHLRDLAEARQVVARVFGGGERLLEEMKAYQALPMGPVEVVWSIAKDDLPWRLDTTLFGAYERLLRRSHGLGERYEAFSMGLARWLVWRHVGSRLSSVLDRQYSEPLEGVVLGELSNPAYDWAAGTAALLRPHKNRGFLRLALGKRTGSQTKADALCCFAFACWLFEGHEGGEASRLAKRLGGEQNDDLDLAFREVFGRTVDQVERRLERWCREVGPAGDAR
jgi:hypothetical protein